MNEMVERVGIAITKAAAELSLIYGAFDYSSYGKNTKPYVVRDYTNKNNQTIGEFDTSEEAHEFYRKACEAYVAKAAIKAMREPTDGMIEQVAWEASSGEIIGYAQSKFLWQAMIDKALND